jgi:small-conductance mechanosensitive channel
MDQFLGFLRDAFAREGILPGVVGTAAWIIILVLIRGAALRFVRSVSWESEDNRVRWYLWIRQGSVLLLVIGLMVVWASELRNLALSAVAIAVALVIAGKELILCVHGAILRTTTESFSVGDRIEIGGVRGDVVSYGMLATKVLEVGPGHQRTGRGVTIPNSMFLTEKVTNETHTEAYVLHSFTYPMSLSDDWKLAMSRLLELATEISAPHVAATEQQMKALARKHGLPAQPVEPRIVIQVPEPGIVHLRVRVPTAARDKGRVEQEILRRFLG